MWKTFIMVCMLKMNYAGLHKRIEKEKINFVEKQEECYFCDLKKSNDAIVKGIYMPAPTHRTCQLLNH